MFIGLVIGVAGTVAVSLMFPVYYAKFITYVSGFWTKAKEDNTEVK